MGAEQPRIEVLPAEELPSPVPAPEPRRSVTLRFKPSGGFADRETALECARRGGEARKRRLRLIASLGLKRCSNDKAFSSYRSAAEEFVQFHIKELAKLAGGEVGPGPSTMVGSAALQLAASRYAYDKFTDTEDPMWANLGSKWADASRQNLLACYELAVREAQARPRQRTDALARFMADPPPKPTEGK